MAMFSVNPSSGARFANFKNPSKEGYLQVIEGDVVAIEYRNRIEFNSKSPKIWQSENDPTKRWAEMDVRLTITNADGQDILLDIPMARFAGNDINTEALKNAKARAAIGLPNAAAIIPEWKELTYENLAGMNVRITPTKEFVKGAKNSYNKWVFNIEFLGKATNEFRGVTSSYKTVEQIEAEPIAVSLDQINAMVGAASALNDGCPF